MKLHGWCTSCNKFRLVTFTAAGVSEGLVVGICDECQDVERQHQVIASHPKHNHVTRDIKAEGLCPACDWFHHENRKRKEAEKREARSAHT